MTEPDDQIPEEIPASPEPDPAPISDHCALAIREIEAFWSNVLLNVSSKVETPIHNFLHSETEALKVRLKNLF